MINTELMAEVRDVVLHRRGRHDQTIWIGNAFGWASDMVPVATLRQFYELARGEAPVIHDLRETGEDRLCR